MRKSHALFVCLVLTGTIAAGLCGPLSADVPPQESATPRQSPARVPQTADLPRSPMMRGLYDAIDMFSEEQFENKDRLLREIRAADELFVRIKRENREGLRRANNPPRFAAQ